MTTNTIIVRRYAILPDGLASSHTDTPFQDLTAALTCVAHCRARGKERNERHLFALIINNVHVAVRDGRLAPVGTRQRLACERAGFL